MTGCEHSDAAYLSAVARGDRKSAQGMIDAIARAAGYDVGPVWHGTAATESRGFPFSVFEMRVGPRARGEPRPIAAAYFTADRRVARGASMLASDFGRKAFPVVGRFYLRGVQRREDVPTDEEYRVTEPSLIKSAEAIVYDDHGRIIPPSRRFDPSSADVRGRVGPAAARPPFPEERAHSAAAAIGAAGFGR